MFTIFQEEKWITAGILVFFGLSLLAQVALGLFYLGMIRETDNMAATDNRLLKQCKLKFANCYQMNNGVSNIPVFVDKFINRLSLGPFSFITIYHLSGQSMLLSVIFSGIGVCRGIMGGRTLGEILPFYIVSFIGLYLYFTVSTVVDIRGKRRILKINLVDYLENHLSARIGVTESDVEMLYGGDRTRAEGSGRIQGTSPQGGDRGSRGSRRTVDVMPISSRELPVPERSRQETVSQTSAEQMQPFRITDEELEELLKEFLPT